MNNLRHIARKGVLSLISILILFAVVELSPGSADAKIFKALQVKMKSSRVSKLIEKRQEEGYDISRSVAEGKRVKELADQGKLDEANALLDKMIADLEQPQDLSRTVSSGLFKNPQQVRIKGYNEDAMEPFLSRDGKILLFNNLNSPKVNTNIHWATRIDDLNFQYKGEVEGLNSPAVEAVPTMDKNNNLYFMSTRSYRDTFITVYRGKFNNGRVDNIEPVKGISFKKRGWLNMDIEISADGNTLFYTQTLFKGPGMPNRSDLYIARKEGDRFKLVNDSSEILDSFNTDNLEYAASISADEKEIYFTRAKHKGLKTEFEILRANRDDRNKKFSNPEILTVFKGFFEAPTLSPDGRLIYYHKKADGKFHIYVVEKSDQK